MPKRWKAFREKNSLSPVPDRVHGTVNAYDNWNCRCEPCRQAKREKMQRYRKRLIRATVEDQQTEGT